MIGKRIKELRLECGLTQKQLADKMGVDQRTLSKYERNINDVHTATLLKLSEIFDVTVDYLLGRAEH